MVKRLIDEISTLVNGSSLPELKQLQQDLANEVLNRETPAEKAQRLFAAMCEECDSIEYGSHWKSEKTADAVGALQSLEIAEVASAIAAAGDDVEAQWRLAIDFTRYIGATISEATDYAGKLVNGSCGDFCSDAVGAAADVWPPLTEAGAKVPSRALIDAAMRVSGFAGDYEGGVCVRQLLTSFLARADVAAAADAAAAAGDDADDSDDCIVVESD
ncbi:hypothetical protein JKP88DRAFT_309714 [Tribonema minus]|uniref:Uncharacterized protein n=1 Tax=Tribonema minus TaxID=303371 RepID=A0A835ZC57_9STRA|nr:hypothetical protein JKP88DRAFT_309714 [Tribonema minus]